jgi:hypothetical protein
MAGSVPHGIRKQLNTSGRLRYQVRYLVFDPSSSSGWVETSSTFATLREANRLKTGHKQPSVECRNRVHTGQERWSRLVSNQRPSACEADALPLSYETGRSNDVED